MKSLYSLIILLVSFSSYGKQVSYENIFNKMYEKKLYFSSYYFLKQAIQKPNGKLNSDKVGKVLDIIHPSIYIHDSELDQFVGKKTELDFAVGLRSFFQNRTEIAFQHLQRIKANHPMVIESSYLMGLIHLKKRRYNPAIQNFYACTVHAKKKQQNALKQEAYIETFKSRCIQQISQILYERKQYAHSLKALDLIHPTDYNWPRLLLDKSWTYYFLNQKSRAVGTLLTYNAPILQRYMIPEASYLRALIYFEHCQFDKVEKIYKEFSDGIGSRERIIRSSSPKQLRRFLASKTAPKSVTGKHLYEFISGYKKDIRYFIYRNSSISLQKEIKQIQGMRLPRLLENLKSYQNIIQQDFLNFLDTLKKDYADQILLSQRHFVKLNLQINKEKRKQLAKTNTNKSKFTTTDLSSIDHDENNYIWSFIGGFWADELGSYAVALENRCAE